MSEKTARENLLAVANAYRQATGLSLGTISRTFHGNAAFLADFSKGKCSITLSKLFQMLQAFRDNWPKGAEWPKTSPLSMSRRGK